MGFRFQGEGGKHPFSISRTGGAEMVDAHPGNFVDLFQDIEYVFN